MEPKDLQSTIDTFLPIDGDIITVFVGPQKARFSVHKELISAKSDFFRAATKREWKEGQERRLELPEETREMFSFYMQWIYRKKLSVIEKSGSANQQARRKLRKLADAIAMGERLQDISLKDVAVDALFSITMKPDQFGTRWYPHATTINTIFANTGENAKVRQLMIDLLAWEGRGDLALKGAYHPAFMDGLARALLTKQGLPKAENPLKGGYGCKYHDHVILGKQCYRDANF